MISGYFRLRTRISKVAVEIWSDRYRRLQRNKLFTRRVWLRLEMEVLRNISTEWIQSLSIFLYSVWFSHKRNHLTTLFSLPGLQVTFIKYSVSFVYYIKEKISLSGFNNTLQQFLVSKQHEIFVKTAYTTFFYHQCCTPPVFYSTGGVT